ncbi:hypothetical protein [Elongatibacter sediminis]|uniref:Lipoprotein n=1 Tax=Elongatibacter sediminis TaxID=3119006 RepID=A0AAW9RHH6_9GAMM
MRFLCALTIVIVGLTSACANQGIRPASAAMQRSFAIELKPKPNGANPELQVKSGPQGYGKGGKKDGYVGFDIDEAGSIIFHIKGEDIGDVCAGSGDADWVITQIALSDSGVESTEKGDNFDSGQDAWLQLAFPDVDLSDGIVFEADWDQASATVAIFDANAHEGQKDVYYRVTATACEEVEGKHATLSTDPMVRNRGK